MRVYNRTCCFAFSLNTAIEVTRRAIFLRIPHPFPSILCESIMRQAYRLKRIIIA